MYVLKSNCPKCDTPVVLDTQNNDPRCEVSKYYMKLFYGQCPECGSYIYANSIVKKVRKEYERSKSDGAV
jgi:primosomal protein N'